jgi:hypothetical protein
MQQFLENYSDPVRYRVTDIEGELTNLTPVVSSLSERTDPDSPQ